MKSTQNKKPIMITFTIMILLELADLLWRRDFLNYEFFSLSLHLSLMICTFIFMYLLFKGDSNASKKLSDSNENLKNIFESLDVAIWSHDLKADVLLITPGIQRLYGYSLDDFIRIPYYGKRSSIQMICLFWKKEQIACSGESCTSIYRSSSLMGRFDGSKIEGSHH